MHAHWRTEARRREVRKQISDFPGASKPNQYVLKLIIDATCNADSKTKSRWGQALKYVWQRCKRITMSRDEFDAFLHDHGGVVGCAAKVAVPKMKPD